jgi:hypothetical protein
MTLCCTQTRDHRLSTQITHWNPVKQHNKDDILDILAYFRSIIIQYQYQINAPVRRRSTRKQVLFILQDHGT